MMEAPSLNISAARDSAFSTVTYWPPSEKESGVTFRTPIT
jgi:hypothetical protein